MRWLLIAIGWLALALGLLGALLPLLPTTPFALLAAACFARASKRCHAMLLAMPVLGPALDDWQSRRGVARTTKVFALCLLWSGIVLSLSVSAPAIWLRVGLLVIAVIVTVVLLRLPTVPSRDRRHSQRAG